MILIKLFAVVLIAADGICLGYSGMAVLVWVTHVIKVTVTAR